MKSLNIFMLILVGVLSYHKSVCAKEVSRVGFISTYGNNAILRSHGGDPLFSALFGKKEIKIGYDINSKNYKLLKKIYEKNDIDLIHISKLTEDEEKIFKIYDSKEEKFIKILNRLSRSYRVSKIIILTDDYISHHYRIFKANQYWSGYNWKSCSVQGYGFFSLVHSDINHRLKDDSLLYAYMSGRLMMFDAKEQDIIFKKDFKFVKEAVIENSFSKQYRDKLYSYVIDGVMSDSMRKKYKKLVYAANFDDEKIRELYIKDNSTNDEFESWLDGLNNVLYKRFDKLSHFDNSTKEEFKKIIDIVNEAQSFIVNSIFSELDDRGINI